jgi:hypothetical protein
MLHPNNKKLLYSFIIQGDKSSSIVHPQELLNQLYELNLLSSHSGRLFLNHENLLTICDDDQDHFFVYIQNGDEYYVNYLNELDSSPFFVKTLNLKEVIPVAEEYVLKKKIYLSTNKKNGKSFKSLFPFI